MPASSPAAPGNRTAPDDPRPAHPDQQRPAPAAEALTRHGVTVVTATIVLMTFAFSLGNVTRLCLDLGITAWIAWLVGPAVDLSVVGLLAGMRYLSLHGYTHEQLKGLQRMLRFCGLLTLAPNTAEAASHHQYGTALVDAVGPALLIGWWPARGCSARSTPSALLPATQASSRGTRLSISSPRSLRRHARLSYRPHCWPGQENWIPSTVRRPAGRSPATTSAPICGLAATAQAL
jgi:Protein of unknown function (DUF2637)